MPVLQYHKVCCINVAIFIFLIICALNISKIIFVVTYSENQRSDKTIKTKKKIRKYLTLLSRRPMALARRAISGGKSSYLLLFEEQSTTQGLCLSQMVVFSSEVSWWFSYGFPELPRLIIFDVGTFKSL